VGAEDALTALVTLLNLATLWFVAAIDGMVFLLRCGTGAGQWWWLVLAAGWALVWVCYEAAVVQARSYGQKLRTAADLHRFELLKTLGVPLPKDLGEERALWKRLFDWMYGYDLRSGLQVAYEHEEEQKEGTEAERKKTLLEWLGFGGKR